MTAGTDGRLSDRNLSGRAGTLRHVALEGPIGVGKTTLTRRLAQALGGQVMLEAPADNPFLGRFYADPAAWALPTQLSFLLQRVRQARELAQRDLFAPLLVSDFMVEKDRLFAELTLQAEEFELYLQVYAEIMAGIPAPDLVIYLHAPVEVLLERISRRGIDYEQGIDAAYLQRLMALYGRFFADYRAAPLLVIDTSTVDLTSGDEPLAGVIRAALGLRAGRLMLSGDDLLGD